MREKLKRNIQNLIIVVLLLALVCGGWLEYRRYKRGSQPEAKTEQIAVVSGTEPQSTDVSVTHEYIGQVQAVNRTAVVPYISGYIAGITATGGQEVKKGDVLLIIRQDEYKAALMKAHAGVLSAQAELNNAQSQFRRLEKAGSQAVSQTELDSAQAAYLAAQAALKQAEAAYYTAQINYNYTYLTAPFDGVLGNISASAGDYITPADENLMTLVQYNPIRVVFSVTDREFLTAREKGGEFYGGDVIRLRLPTGEIYDEGGQIKYTANVADKTTNSVAVYAEFSNVRRELLPDAYVKVLLQRRYKNVVLLGKEYVEFKPDGEYVYFAENGILTLKKVEILADYENQYVLSNTFGKGFIVTEDADARLIGKKVEVKTAGEGK